MSKHRCFRCWLAALLALACTLTTQARTFQLTDGSQLNGEVVSFKNGTIVIAKDGGGKGLYTLASFSEADQAYLNDTYPDGATRDNRPGTATKKPEPAPQPTPAATPTQSSAQRQPTEATQPAHPGLKNLRVGMNAPAIKARVHGKADFTSLDDMNGKIVVVHFWSTAVPQSIKELEGLAYLHQKYKDRGFELIGVAMDQSQRRVNSIEREFGVSWPMRMDEERQTIDEWGVVALPTNVLIDQVGVIRAPHISAHDLQYVLAKQLGEPK
ncbi:MAG: TlpA disulfide reductase family protein [Puniceicoccales bacterium]